MYAIRSYYVIKDHLGSVWALANETGGFVEKYAYDPWGRRMMPRITSYNVCYTKLLRGLNWPKYLADGVDVQNDYILDSITVYHNNNRLSALNFNYDSNLNLLSIVKSGLNGKVWPATRFGYKVIEKQNQWTAKNFALYSNSNSSGDEGFINENLTISDYNAWYAGSGEPQCIVLPQGPPITVIGVITSYSIHYTKLYETFIPRRI